MLCKLCGNSFNNTPYYVKEMMLGTRDIFNYFQCGACECLQIAEIPSTINKYYPKTYYSFAELEENNGGFFKKIKNILLKKRDLYAVTKKGILGQFLYKLRPLPELHTLASHIINKNTSILDVGCGTGHYLYKLKNSGFNNLLGIDPYIEKKITYKNGLTIDKKYLTNVDGLWDVIMLHHSLEHIEHQLETLSLVASLMKENGICLIRIPTVTSYPWEHYRENWVHLDAPRHFFIHSYKSLEMLVEKVGLSIVSITSDANAFSFYGSELYAKNIPATEWKKHDFTKKEMRSFARLAQEINQLQKGDTIAVILKKRT